MQKKLITDNNSKKYHKVGDHCHYTGKQVPVVFHNGSTYDYHFVIKEFSKNWKVNLNM